VALRDDFSDSKSIAPVGTCSFLPLAVALASACIEANSFGFDSEDHMTCNADEVRDLILAPNCTGVPTRCIAGSAWLIKTTCGRSGENVGINKTGVSPESYSTASDDLLLIAAQSADHQAFVELCRRYSPMVKKKIFSIVRNQEDTEDALQDTLLRAFNHLPAFRRDCKFSSWLTTIGINMALMALRKRKIRKEGQAEPLNEDGAAWDAVRFVDPAFDPEYMHSRNQIFLMLRREIEKLKPTLRSMIEQYYGAECSVEDSAKALDISVGSAKSRLLRGRKRLRSSLKRHGVLNSRVY
jgi:RNA polymerase sigma-70 factor (ECF subfamily)